MCMDDRELLSAYVDGRDEEAFAQLVRLHGDWVQAAARRQLRDRHLAEDTAQAVFMMLARRAGKLKRYAYLGGWLYRAMEYCVRETQRHRSEEHWREQEVAKMRHEEIRQEANWEEIAPVLEAAVGKLGKKDREVVLLRFYQRKPLAEVGECLGISEKAAQKRVERAVGKLREKLADSGVAVEAGSLGAMVLAHAVEGGMEGGTAGLVEKVMAGIGGGGGNGTAGLIAKGAEKMMVWAKVKVAAVVIVVGATAALVSWTYAAGDPASQPSPDQGALIKQLGDSESQLLNVSMSFDSWQERRTSDAGRWRKTDVALRGHAWYNGIPNTKARINFDSEVLDWNDGESAMHESSYDAGFDGKTGRLVRRTSGPSGRVTPTRTGEILPKAPSVLRSGWYAFATGIGCSRFYVPDADGRDRPLSKVLQAYARRGGLETAREKIDGVSAVRLTLKCVPKTKTSYWLDPSRGYALIRSDVDFEGRPEQSYSLHVTKVAELAPGLWFATEGYREYQDRKQPGTMLRTWFRTSDVKANDSHFDESIFTIVFPEGYHVDDQVAGISNVSGEPGIRDPETDLDRAVNTTVRQTKKER